MGWVCWNGLVFDAERVSRWLEELAQWPGSRRIKAVVRTDRGWWGLNFADGIEEAGSYSARRDSRLELVIEGDRPPDPDVLDEEVRACLTSESAAAGGSLVSPAPVAGA